VIKTRDLTSLRESGTWKPLGWDILIEKHFMTWRKAGRKHPKRKVSYKSKD